MPKSERLIFPVTLKPPAKLFSLLCSCGFESGILTRSSVTGFVMPSKVNSPIMRPRVLSSHFILTTIFLSNFIGVVFARTLHYQFYVWYFHTLPYLLWHAKRLPVRLKLLLLVNIEVGFHVYPATSLSSGMLQLSHIIILVALYLSNAPMMENDDDNITKKKE